MCIVIVDVVDVEVCVGDDYGEPRWSFEVDICFRWESLGEEKMKTLRRLQDMSPITFENDAFFFIASISQGTVTFIRKDCEQVLLRL